ncbi:hypothetical protein ACTXT7_000253 [Hymenolepis weldensis]
MYREEKNVKASKQSLSIWNLESFVLSNNGQLQLRDWVAAASSSLSTSRPTENRRRHRASPSQHNPPSKIPHDRVCRAPKRSRHRSSGLHHPRESISVPPSTLLPQSLPKIEYLVSSTPSTRNSNREKRKKVRQVMHKRMSQQRVADWLIATHGNQAGDTTNATASCTPPLIVF